MSSLRARLLTGVLLLSAVGLIVLGAIVYVEQRSFLQGRLDDQVRAALPAMGQLLDREGFYPPGSRHASSVDEEKRAGGTGTTAGATTAPAGPTGTSSTRAATPPTTVQQHGNSHGEGGGGGLVNLPPGTYGERRTADGKVIGQPVLIKFSSSESSLPLPRLPVSVPLNRYFSVGSEDSTLRYRAFAQKDPEDTGITVVAVPERDAEQTLHRLLIVELLVIAGVLVALAVGTLIVINVGLRPLDRMRRTAGEIAEGDLSRRVTPATEKTEIGRLGLALNAMLERLERAFASRKASEDRLRQFIADASHELRTPLSSIRGYAELFRMGAASDPADTERAMRRIEEEARRMGVLVEDLLTLARLDETRERERGPVDVSALAHDAVDDARVTAPEREISVAAPAGAVVIGDPDQLLQVLANLLRNALTHTPPGTPVEVSVEPVSGNVELVVRDHGPGLPPGAAERLFERFWRSEGGRRRGRGGAGLGLAIARAIVESHGGSIDARNDPAGGARFRVLLPAAPAGSQAQPRPARESRPASGAAGRS